VKQVSEQKRAWSRASRKGEKGTKEVFGKELKGRLEGCGKNGEINQHLQR